MDLYVTDLDGTLLDKEKNISDYSIKVINNFIEKGNNFTVATARSLSSAKDIIEPLNIKLPIILNNGGFIYDPIKKINLVSNYMNNETSKELLLDIDKMGLNPFIHLEDNKVNKMYYKGVFNYGEKFYYDNRIKVGDKRFTKVNEFNIENKDIITVFLIGKKEELNELYLFLKQKYDNLQFHFFLDVYSNYHWLEINSHKATKKNGIKFLKNYLKVNKVSCFGDNLNDISMFEECDYSYAVKNAHEDLIKISTKVIDSNLNNGVAKIIEEKVNI